MAIDTAAKRKSCIGIALIFVGAGVIPDGTDLSAPERLDVQGLYAGIAAGSPVAQVISELEFDGQYVITLAMDGQYAPTLAYDGEYIPTIELDGEVE